MSAALELWRVGEFRSPSTPSKTVLCLVVGDDIERDETREDFIRWVSPAPARRGRDRYTGNPELEWVEFWRDIVAPGGVVDVEQVKKELSDLSMLIHHVPQVYMHATGGMVSYAHTLPDVVCGLIDDHINDVCAGENDPDEIDILTDQRDTLAEALKAARDTLHDLAKDPTLSAIAMQNKSVTAYMCARDALAAAGIK